MQDVSNKIGIDKVSLVKAIDFLPYPFLISEFRDGAQHNIFVNKKFVEEIGYTCQDIPTVNDWFTLAYPDTDYRNTIMLDWSDRINAARETGQDSVVKQARILTRYHGPKWYEIKASLFGPINFVAFVNIDEEITREQRLERLNENMDRTLSILSHDLRAPLSTLYSVLQLFSVGQITEAETKEPMEKIRAQVFSVLEFMDTTLQWSKINFTELQIRPQVIEIDSIVKQILNIYKAAYSQKQILINNTIQSSIPLCFDPEIFSILFRNIFSNAIKYTPEGGAITISSESQNNRYALSIENTGQGLTQEKIQMILSKKYQSERGTMGEKGLGLGLKLCQQLLEKIEGNLEIESKNSSSTIFRIVLSLP